MTEKKEETKVVKETKKQSFHFPAQGKRHAINIKAANMKEALSEYEKLVK